jgi:hypothetical protein
MRRSTVAIAAVLALGLGWVRSAQSPAADCSSPTPGQIIACNGAFWQDGKMILLHGLNTSGISQTEEMTRKDYERIAALHMNVVRMRVGWAQFEADPPTNNHGMWIHHYKTGLVPTLVEQIRFAHELGIASLIESRCFCGRGWPVWLGDAAYNSHGKTYDLQTLEGRQEFNTDYWTDPLLQKFTKDWVVSLAKWLEQADGIVGYEPLDEPSSGTLNPDHTTTQMVLDWQLELARAVRDVDPNRVIFFATRGSSGVGIQSADLSGWVDLGNVAFDPHDFFGARWGSGFDVAGDPTGPGYGESAQVLFNFTLNAKMPPYLGTIEGQARFLETFKGALAPTGIPVFVGEFSGNTDGNPPDPNILALYGTMSHAMNLEGVSWTALSYDGYHSLFDPDGTLRAWATILCNAAAYPKVVRDCPEPG